VDVMTALAPLAGEKLSLSDEATEIVQAVKQLEALDVGITERVKQLLDSQVNGLFAPVVVRSHLEAAKYDLSKHPNPMATIHAVLKRLVEQQKAVAMPFSDGKTGYRTNTPLPAGTPVVAVPRK